MGRRYGLLGLLVVGLAWSLVATVVVGWLWTGPAAADHPATCAWEWGGAAEVHPSPCDSARPVTVTNFPASQPVTVGNFPVSQPVSGTVTADRGTGWPDSGTSPASDVRVINDEAAPVVVGGPMYRDMVLGLRVVAVLRGRCRHREEPGRCLSSS